MNDILAKRYSMKEKSKKDNRSLTSLIDELETSINATGDSVNQELIKEIKQRNNEKKKVDKTFSNFLLFCICVLVFSALGNFLLLDRNDQMEREFASSNWKDSLFNAIMEPDSNMTVTYGVHGDGRVVTYHQLEKQKDSISRKYEDEKLKNRINQDTHVDREMFEKLLLENEKLKDRIDVIKSTYHIQIIEEKDGYRLVSPVIDSALVLLPYYRNMLKYNNKDHSWSIKIVK